MLSLAEATRLHLEELASKDASPRTLRQYASVQRGYREWLQATLGVPPTVDHLTVALTRRWTLHLAEHGRPRIVLGRPREGKPCGANTRALYLAVLKSLSAFLAHEDAEDGVAYLKADPLAKAKPGRRKEHPVEVVTEDEFERLVKRCTETRWPLRNRAILLLLHSTGVRVSELCSLTLADITLADHKLPQGSVRVRRGKGGKPRTVPIPFGLKTSHALSRYLTHTHGRAKVECRDPWLFLDQDGTPLQPPPVRRLLERLADAAGIVGKVIRPHSLRRSCATNWARSGVPVTTIAEWLGHSTLDQVRRYIKVAELLDTDYRDPVDSWKGIR